MTVSPKVIAGSSVAGPIFVTGAARSGTTLLTRMLDGHPSLLVFPIELKYFRYRDTPTLFPTVKLDRQHEPTDVLEAVTASSFLRPLVGGDEEVGGRAQVLNAIRERVDTVAFGDALRRPPAPSSHPEAFLLFFRALLAGVGRDPSAFNDLRIVEKTPYQEENVPELLTWFPDARFVHVIRNPYATMVSERRRSSSGLPHVHTARMLRDSMRLATRHRRTYGVDRYLIIRYEDIVADTEAVIGPLIRFLGISDDPILRRPTILGREWTGNSALDRQFDGISTAPTTGWQEALPIEIIAVNRFAASAMREFGYDRLPSPSILRIRDPYGGDWHRILRAIRVLLGGKR